jgi:hypothetical protein
VIYRSLSTTRIFFKFLLCHIPQDRTPRLRHARIAPRTNYFSLLRRILEHHPDFMRLRCLHHRHRLWRDALLDTLRGVENIPHALERKLVKLHLRLGVRCPNERFCVRDVGHWSWASNAIVRSNYLSNFDCRESDINIFYF